MKEIRVDEINNDIVIFAKDVSLTAKSRSKVIMNKIIGLAVLLFCLSGCVRDNDAIYYPVGNVDVERGGPALEAGKGDWSTSKYAVIKNDELCTVTIILYKNE